MNKVATFILIVFVLVPGQLIASNYSHGWLSQAAPSRVIVCEREDNESLRMLTASLAGLCAQAVNEGTYSEMVWEDIAEPSSYVSLYSSVLNSFSIDTVHEMSVFELLEYLARDGVVKGYVLFREDKSEGRQFSRRKGIDFSANVATVYAAVLGGALIEEKHEEMAKALGLECLRDCRDISPDACFAELKDSLSNKTVVFMDPKLHNCRDYAIAHRLMVGYDVGPLSEVILEWAEPLSPVVGWNCPDEFSHTSMVSRWGLFNTASDRCENMTMLSAAVSGTGIVEVHGLDPSKIDYDDYSSFHSFLLSDGDNMQWSEGMFVVNTDFYGADKKECFSMNWTSCTANLVATATPAWNVIASSKPADNSIVEFSGGYYYPDMFASARPDRMALLDSFSKDLSYGLSLSGSRMLCCICNDVHSSEAKEAFSSYVSNIDNLVGIVALQYYPYELGGDIQWFPDKNGVMVPVVTAKYSLWDADDPQRPNAGGPGFVSKRINSNCKDNQELSFTIVHAWSSFDGNRGINAVEKTMESLNDNIKVVSMEELFWRIRMKYYPEDTNGIIEKNKGNE